MDYWIDTLKVIVGMALLTYPIYTTAVYLLVRFSPSSISVGNGDVGAVVAFLIFLLGAGLTTHGLLTGIEKASK